MGKRQETGLDMDKRQSRLEKWFPPRQILLRSQTEVRHITLAPWLQKTVAGALALTFVWGAYASYNTVFRDQILEAKDAEIAALEAESAAKSEDLKTLQTTIMEKTDDLEARQGYLESILENDPTGELPEAEDVEESVAEPVKESRATPSGGFFIQSANAATPKMDSREFVAYIEARLAEIEAEQAAIAGRLNTFAQSQLVGLDDMLAPFKLTAADLARSTDLDLSNVGQGGPFIPDGPGGIDFATDHPFPHLQENWTTLLKVYSGFKNMPLTEVPVKDYYLSSRYGTRTDPFTKKRGWHSGIDLAGWPGTPIYATTEGVVTKAGHWGTYGYMVEIKHGNGFMTRYAHLRKVTAKRGQTVKPGDMLGEMGCTGRCASTHLHYEVYFNGNLRNPQLFMEAPEDVQQTKKRANTPNPNSGTGD